MKHYFSLVFNKKKKNITINDVTEQKKNITTIYTKYDNNERKKKKKNGIYRLKK